MNSNLLFIVKRITAQYGEAILTDPARLKAFFSDLAKDEPKPLRIAFGRCVESGAYTALKTAPDAAERVSRKAAIAQQMRDEHGLDAALCGEALDILEAALYGTASAAQPPFTPQPAPPPQQPYQQPAPYQPQQTSPQPQYQQPNPVYDQVVYPTPPPPTPKTGGKWRAVLICNILNLNWLSRFITGHIGTGILILLLDFVSIAGIVTFGFAIVEGEIMLETALKIILGIVGICFHVRLIIWIVDLVKICLKKWRMTDGTYLVP